MQQARFWKPRILFLAVPMLLLLMMTGAEAQVPAASGKAKVDRLVMGLIEKYRDYMRPVDQWHPGPHDPARPGI